MNVHPTGWGRSDEDNIMVVTVQLNCGHRIIASEDDGGMDEVRHGASWKLLESVARQRVVTHAILGCDIVWAGKMFIDRYNRARADYGTADELAELGPFG